MDALVASHIFGPDHDNERISISPDRSPKRHFGHRQNRFRILIGDTIGGSKPQSFALFAQAWRPFGGRSQTSCLPIFLASCRNRLQQRSHHSRRKCCAQSNSMKNDYDWIEDFCYCGDGVDGRGNFCKRPVAGVGGLGPGRLSVAIPNRDVLNGGALTPAGRMGLELPGEAAPAFGPTSVYRATGTVTALACA